MNPSLNTLINTQSNWPDVADTSLNAMDTIGKLSPEEKTRVAAQRIFAGYTLYFSMSPTLNPSPFSHYIMENVIELLEKSKEVKEGIYKVNKVVDERFECTIYDDYPKMQTFGFELSLKKLEQSEDKK